MVFVNDALDQVKQKYMKAWECQKEKQRKLESHDKHFDKHSNIFKLKFHRQILTLQHVYADRKHVAVFKYDDEIYVFTSLSL